MTYTIERDGDDLEKLFYPRLSSLFPLYEEFWRVVVVPLTMRDIDGTIDLRPGVDRDLELLAMSHYSCYCHLGIAHELLETVAKSPYLYDDFFFHLRAAVEMVEKLLKFCASLRAKIHPPQKSQSNYNALTAGLDKGWQTIKLNFDHLAEETRLYRNAFTHDPRLGQWLDENGKRWIPKQDKLTHNLPWSDVHALAFPDEFVDLDDLTNRLMREVPTRINKLWSELISEFANLSTLDPYQRLACTGPYQPAPPTPTVTVQDISQPIDDSHTTAGSGIKHT